MNINNIDVNKYQISQILDSDLKIVYEIPKYQREYVWGINQWESLFDDLYENNAGYFLGSMICINISKDLISNLKFEVVDGQQRLTTISLFFIAIYSILYEKRSNLDEDQKSDLLQLKRKLILKNSNNETRIIPQVQNNNLEDYMYILATNGLIEKRPMVRFAGNRRIVKAFTYFKTRVQRELTNSANALSTLFEILEKLNSAILVIINVENHSDAYTLFESLNNRGTPLTSIDLIKNLVLSKIDSDNNENINYYYECWKNIISNLGDEYSVQERFFRQYYNAFRKDINANFERSDRLYPLGSIATRSNLLEIYEKIVNINPKKFLEDIIENSSIYSTIIINNEEKLSIDLENALHDLQRVQGVPSYLLILYFMKKSSQLNIIEIDLIKIIRLLINFFIRRNLTDSPPTRDLTSIFMNFIDKLETSNYKSEMIYLNLKEWLNKCSSSKLIFEEKLRGPIYSINSDATRFILCMLAKHGMTKETELDLWKTTSNKQYVWTIEHILPQGQNIPESWINMISNGDKELATSLLKTYVHTIGNLTITGYNSTLGNRSFQEKKERKDNKGAYIGYKNGLNLNVDVCDKDEWNIEAIKNRTDRLVNLVLEISDF